jgi:ParB family transcriptional regulator, chromosome partitioning protein
MIRILLLGPRKGKFWAPEKIFINTIISNLLAMKVRNIPIELIDVAEENVRKDQDFGKDSNDKLMKEHLTKFDLLQPVVVRFDDESRRYKLLIGRRRFFALSAKGVREVPAVITELEGAEAEAASLFENLIRKDLSPLEKARMVRKLVDSTRGGITGASAKYGLPKSTISEWLSILTLPAALEERIEKSEITSYEAIRIARKPEIHNRLVAAVAESRLQEEMVAMGVKRGAPKGLLTVRLVFNPRKKSDRKIWECLNEKASQSGLEVTDYVRNIVAKHVQ